MTTSDSTMNAYRFNPTTLEFSLKEVPIPKPDKNEVLVKILAAGVCHSDVTTLYHSDAIWTRAYRGDSFTMGHEGAGIISELGSAVAEQYPGLSVGTYVAIYIVDTCHTCRVCKQGRENLCRAKPPYGVGLDGTWASYMAVSASSAIPVPHGIPSAIAAVATDAVLSPYHAMKTVADVKPGQTILVVGCGGLGQNAVQIAKRCLGAGTILACDIREESLQLAREAGADYVVHPDGLQQLLQEENLIVDVAFDFVGKQSTFEAVVTIIPWGGKMVLVGIGAKSVELPMMWAVIKEIQILTCFGGTKAELKEVLDIIAEGKINPRVDIRSFEDTLEVVRGMREGKVRSRTALIPKS